MNFVYKGLIMYILYLILLVISDILLGGEIQFPTLTNQIYGIGFITWIGIGDVLEALK